MYTERFYRDFKPNTRWQTYRVKQESTDLYIRSIGNYTSLVQKMVAEIRTILKNHILRQPEFLKSMTPVQAVDDVQPVIEKMIQAAAKAHVGPMASVAGAVAEFVGSRLIQKSEEVIVENGGDNFLKLKAPSVNKIFAGNSPFSGKLGIHIDPQNTPIAVCTSSGTVGHSFSYGQIDAATIIAHDACLADAVATGAANMVNSQKDLDAALEYAHQIQEISGVVLIFQDKLAVQGNVKLVRT